MSPDPHKRRPLDLSIANREEFTVQRKTLDKGTPDEGSQEMSPSQTEVPFEWPLTHIQPREPLHHIEEETLETTSETLEIQNGTYTEVPATDTFTMKRFSKNAPWEPVKGTKITQRTPIMTEKFYVYDIGAEGQTVEFIAETGTLRISKPDGSIYTLSHNGYLPITGPAIGPDGTIAFRTRDHIYALYPDDTIRALHTDTKNTPGLPAFTKDGTLYTTSIFGISLFLPGGAHKHFLLPESIIHAEHDNVEVDTEHQKITIVTDAEIWVSDFDGSATMFTLSDPTRNLQNTTIAPDGTIYIDDTANREILHLHPETHTIETLSNSPFPVNMAKNGITPDGHIVTHSKDEWGAPVINIDTPNGKAFTCVLPITIDPPGLKTPPRIADDGALILRTHKNAFVRIPTRKELPPPGIQQKDTQSSPRRQF